MQPAPGPAFWPELFLFNTITIVQLTVHCSHILQRNQCLSIAVCFQIRSYAARALCGPGPALTPVLPGRRIRVETLY